MKISAVSKKYSLALVESAAGSMEAVVSDLESFLNVMLGSQELENFFANPVISVEEKFKILDTNLKAFHPIALGFIKTLIENKRVHSLAGIIRATQSVVDSQRGVIRGQVQSSVKLTDDLKKRLEEKIQSIVNKKVELSYELDPSLLGGVIAHVGGWTFDDTIKTQLNKLNDDLNRSVN